MGIIGFENYRIPCIIGVYPEEQFVAQEIFVDLRARVHLKEALASDALEHAVDYTILAQLCSRLAQQKRYKLIESYASDVLAEVLCFDKVAWAWIRVKKPMALWAAKFAFVEMEREK